MATLDYKLTVRNQADTADLLTATSLATGTNPYIVGQPSGDGQSFDIVTGAPTVGAYRVRVADQNRVITQTLTDASGHQQHPGRKATVSVSEDRGATWSTLVAGYVNELVQDRGLVFEFTAGETSRIEQVTRIFTRRTTSFDAMSCLIGGPVRGGFGPIKDFGGWRMHVDGATGDRLSLTFVSGYQVRSIHTPEPIAWGGYEFVKGTITPYARQRIEGIAKPFFVQHPNATQGDTTGSYLGLEARVEALDGTLLGTWTPLSEATGGAELLRDNRLFLGAGPAVSAGVVGTDVNVYVYPTDIGPDSPLHVSGHPCDLIRQLWLDFGVAVDDPSWTATRDAIGPHRGVALRLTDPKGMLLADFQKMLFGLFGFSYRVGLTGKREMFPTRVRASQAPAVVLTSADLRGPGDTPWKTSEGTILTKLVITTKSFALWKPSDNPGSDTRPIDEITVTPIAVEVDNPNTTGLGEKTAQYDLPGDIYDTVTGPLWASTIGTSQEVSVQAFANAVGSELFDRLGTGLPAGTLPFRRGVTAQVGDLVVLDVDHLPNGSVRGGQRVVQITKRTETPGGPELSYADAGSSAQTGGTTPTFTVAKDTATDPRRYARVSLTNAATLSAAGLALRIEWAFGATAPADGGTLLARLDPTALATTTAIRTPRVQAGALVWVRVRAEQQGEVPGPYTTWSSAQLDPITAPSGLTVTPVAGDATEADVAWTLGDTDVPVTVRVGLVSDPTTQRIVTLPAGSVKYRLTGLTTSTTYAVDVTQEEEAPWDGASTTLSTTFTTPAGGPTLAAPADPVGVVGREVNPFAIPGVQLTGNNGGYRIDGTYGIDVTATDAVGPIVVEVATETAAGSGTPGTYAVQSPPLAPQQLGRMSWRGVAPNDGLKRFLRAKTTRAGLADSAYCAVQIVDHWAGVQRAEDVPIAAPAFAVTPTARATDAGVQLWGRITFTKPTSPYYARTRFTITPPAAAAFTLEAVDASTPLEFAMGWGVSYQITAAAITTSGVVGDASVPQTAVFGLFTNPGVPKGTPIYDPGVFDPATGAPAIARVVQGDPGNSDGLALHPSVTQSDGVTQRVLAKGHIQGTARNGVPVTFAQPFQNPPLVTFAGGISYEPRSKWNASGDGTTAPLVAPLTTAQYDVMVARDLSASGFTGDFRLRQRGTPTPHTDRSWGTTSLTGSGQTSEISPSALPSAGDTYTAHYNVSLHSGLSSDAIVTVAVDTFHFGDIWRNRANQTYTQPAGGGTLSLTDETQQITVSGLVSGDKIRLRISALQAQTVTITPVSVTYTTAAGDQYASKTPETDDVVQWDAIAVE